MLIKGKHWVLGQQTDFQFDHQNIVQMANDWLDEKEESKKQLNDNNDNQSNEWSGKEMKWLPW